MDHRSQYRTDVKPTSPSFFKIILRETLENKKLSIPTRFAEEHGDLFSENATLILPNGHSWNVGIIKSPNEIWFDSNWHEFVQHCTITEKNFLVFFFKSMSTFEVHIFDRSCCEINYPSYTPNDEVLAGFGKESSFHQVDEILETDEGEGSQGPLASPKQKKRRETIHSATPTSEVPKNGKHKEVEMPKKGSKKGEAEDIENTKGDLGMYSIGYRGSHQGSAKAIHSTRMFKSKNPYFTVLLQEYNFNYSTTYFPTAFSRKYTRNVAGLVTLVNVDDGRQWILKVNRRKHGRLNFGGGWTNFYKENDLKTGDVCIFELIEKDVFQVSINRA